MNEAKKRIDGTNILLLNEQESILLQLRDDKPNIPYPNMWALPGGHREEQETPLECILREVKEELGIELNEVALFRDAERFYGREHTYWTRVTFRLEDIVLLEGQKVQWFSYNEINNMQLIYEDNRIIDEFFQQRPFEDDKTIAIGGNRSMSDTPITAQGDRTSFKKRSLYDLPKEPTRHGALKRVLLHHEEVDSPSLMFLNEVYVQVGEQISAHQHEDMEEVFYFLEGRGEMQIAGEIQSVIPGDRVIVPMQTLHILTNTDNSEMRFICFGVKTVLQSK